MEPEVRDLLKHSGFCAAVVEQLAATLPEDDLELDAWIEETVRERSMTGFILLSFAALSRNRPVDARHLATGKVLVGASWYAGVIALRVQGEMPEYLLQGIAEAVGMDRASRALAFLCIALWCDERRNGLYPDQLIPKARALARDGQTDFVLNSYLVELAARTEDKVLHGLIRGCYPRTLDSAVWKTLVSEGRQYAQQVIAVLCGPLSAILPQEPTFPVDTSVPEAITVRRAVPRIGRNDACPCGSGRKYKNCCSAKDAKRLQESSEVAGLTKRELAAQPERDLTLRRLQKQSASQLVAMDVSGVPRYLLPEFFFRLSLVDLDRSAANLEKLGYEDDLEDGWFITMFNAIRANRKDIGDRLMTLRQPFGIKEEDLRLSQRLLLAQDEPAKWLRLVESAAHNALKSENTDDLEELAFAVAFSDASALGMLLYRAVLPFRPARDPETAYSDMILPIRERLNLPVNDPLKDFLDTRRVDAGPTAPEKTATDQPVRLIKFPRNFHKRLSTFPQPVARGTIALLGRLGSGDSAAFHGAKRLKSASAVYHQFVGTGYRLLFRLLPEQIEVIDLIPSQDLERKTVSL